MRLLDDHVVLTPGDLAQCDFALVRQVAEGRGLTEAVVEPVFMADRVAELTGEQQERVRREYQRRYTRTFVELPPPRESSLADLREHHERTLAEVNSLRAVAGGSVVIEVAPGVMVHSAPALLLPAAVADTVLERFARAGDLARLGGHVVALNAATARPVAEAYLHLNNDRRQELAAGDLQAVAASRIAHLARLLGAAVTAAEPWPWADPAVSQCGFCAWCRTAAEEHRDVQLVWGMRRGPREALRRAGITTIEELAATTCPPGNLDAFSWERLRDRARLQLRQEETPGEVFAQVHDPAVLERLPAPSSGDVFFDFEGDPFWVEKNRWEWGLEYLFGFIEADTGEYKALWATNQAEEKVAFTRFLDYVSARQAAYPDMHVYHFAFYEPATLRRLARRHRTGQQLVNEWISEGVFVDLYETVKAGVHVSQRSYGLKALEPLYMGEDLRASGVTDGGAAVAAYEAAVRARARGDEATWQATVDDLADYNRYDCESTRRLRDWLLGQRESACATDTGVALARELLGARTLDTELLLTPLEEESEDVSGVALEVPGFDESGIFYVSSGNSTDALGPAHKVHELLGRWGSGSPISSEAEVLVVYEDPATSSTTSLGLTARKARVRECEDVEGGQRVLLREDTPAHDPNTSRLVPSFLRIHTPTVDAAQVLKRAKQLTYSLITGPAGSGKSALAATQAGQGPIVVIDDAHQITIVEALARIAAAESAEHVLVVGDPARAIPVPPRALPLDLVNGPLLSWLLGDSGARIHERTELTTMRRAHHRLGAALQAYAYEGAELAPPGTAELHLLPEELAGLHVRTISHRGNRDASPEEAGLVADLVKHLLAVSPLTESDILVTAVYDAQVLLLQRALTPWPGVGVVRAHESAGAEAAVSILSIGSSTLLDAPFGRGPHAPHLPVAPHVLTAGLSRAREAGFVVCSEHLLEQLPPRGAMFSDVARFADLVSRSSGDPEQMS